MTAETTNIIRDKDFVILKRGDYLRVFKVELNRQVFLDKVKFTLNGIIGHPYGTSFEVKDGAMVKIDRASRPDSEWTGKAGEMGSEKDNRNLQDSDSNQKLSRDEIEQMKKDGVSREHLIEQLIENSTTFQVKTEYSKEKWVKKKKKKHLLVFTVLRPNTRLMCQMHWAKNSRKICNLRIDSLAQMLTHGNVRAGTTVLVVDTCEGLVTGAVLERLGGFGNVICFFPGDKVNSAYYYRTLLKPYNFSKEIMDTLHYFPLNLVNSLKDISGSKLSVSENDTETQSASELSVTQSGSDLQSENNVSETQSNGATVIQSPQAQSAATEQTGDKSSGTQSVAMEETGDKSSGTQFVDLPSGAQSTQDWKSMSKQERRKAAKKARKGNVDEAFIQKQKQLAEERRNAEREMIDKDIEISRKILLQKNCDCLLVASKFHSTPIVTALVDYLSPSRQVVVFSQFLEAVEDCYVHLREAGGMINFKVTETWLREYQVLPNRTHPVINMSGTGGYLLVATKVVKSE